MRGGGTSGGLRPVEAGRIERRDEVTRQRLGRGTPREAGGEVHTRLSFRSGLKIGNDARRGGERGNGGGGGERRGEETKARVHGRPSSSTLNESVSGLLRLASEPDSEAETMRA